MNALLTDIERDICLTQMWENGDRIDDIAATVEMSAAWVSWRRRELGLRPRSGTCRPKPDHQNPRFLPAMRMCLRCLNDFKSSHAGNRICRSCKTGVELERPDLVGVSA